ncbi:MAG: class SAM-dependent methyltransferase [Myxococcales bacterium]|nr:class SAM-dependent methyltransferase [Myxococcales bacterium]
MSTVDASKRVTGARGTRGAGTSASPWASRLAATALRRAPYAPLYKELLAALLAAHSSPGSMTLELGAGAGQLRTWLPATPAATWLHTEPDDEALRLLRRRFPDARTARASAESVPVADESVDTSVGLCVLDVVADLEQVAREQLRVLAPGGCFVHLLDMTTALDRPLAELHAAGCLALPNLLSDPTAERWPADLLLAQRRPFQRLFALMLRDGHTRARLFADLFEPFFREPFDGGAAARAFLTLSASPGLRAHLLSFMIDAERTALDLGLGQMQTVPLSSARHFARRLDQAFSRAGFEISRSDIAGSSLLLDRPAGDPYRYRGICVGHERLATELPPSLLCPNAARPGPGEQRLELGVFVFVARKPAATSEQR